MVLKLKKKKCEQHYQELWNAFLTAKNCTIAAPEKLYQKNGKFKNKSFIFGIDKLAWRKILA